MKYYFSIYILIIFTFIGCDKQHDEIVELSSFLQTNYEFNIRAFNSHKADYYLIIDEMPKRKIEKLNQLDVKFELLILDINNAISNKNDNLNDIYFESKKMLNEISVIVDNKKDYSVSNLNFINTNSNEFNLRCLKNKLVIAMAYAFEYRSKIAYSADSLPKIEVDSIFSQVIKNRTLLTLTSKYGQTINQNRHIIVDKIEFNGRNKNIDYKIKNNYSFANIEFDSLKKGTYQVNGVLRFYHRDGKFDIPFEKEFNLE